MNRSVFWPAIFATLAATLTPTLGAETLMIMDTPLSQISYLGRQTWGGWALDGFGSLAQAQVFVDGAYLMNAQIISRPDVCQAEGNYPGCPNVGYSYSINAVNTPPFTNGTHTLTVTAIFSDGNQVSRSVTFGVTYNQSGTTLQGCQSEPCLDTIPATYTSGSWIEYGGSSGFGGVETETNEWTITAYNASPGVRGSMSGYVLVFPPSDAYTCPVFTYSAVGNYTPSSVTAGTQGYTNFVWEAYDPSPNITCSGYSPVGGMQFSGTIANEGNDTAYGSWTNDSGVSGPLYLETNLILTPTSESLTSYGWGKSQQASTQMNVIQTLADNSPYDPSDPNGNKFQGRQVYEVIAGTDACYSAAQTAGFIPTPDVLNVALAGAVWNVGPPNAPNSASYGYDSIGYGSSAVNYYQGIPSILPCTTTLTQNMMMVNQVQGQGDNQFATHTITLQITAGSVTVTKDSLSMTQ